MPLRQTPSRRILLASNPFQDVNNNRKADALNGVSPHAPAVILVRTFLDQNVGAVARAMLNFGLADLRLVDPQCNHLSDAARSRAAGAQHLVLERATVFPTVAAASADLGCTFATTARLRDMTVPVVTPPELAARVAANAAASAAAAAEEGEEGAGAAPGRFGLLFGPEQSGLTNADVAGVDALVQVATNPNFASLNLAQAVNIVAYECYLHTSGLAFRTAAAAPAAVGEAAGAAAAATLATSAVVSLATSSLALRKEDRLATKGEVGNLLRRLSGALDEAGYRSHSPGAKQSASEKLAALAGRTALTDAEVSLLHGVLSALAEVKQARAATIPPGDRRGYSPTGALSREKAP